MVISMSQRTLSTLWHKPKLCVEQGQITTVSHRSTRNHWAQSLRCHNKLTPGRASIEVIDIFVLAGNDPVLAFSRFHRQAKRDNGQASRGKSYVEEEKRLLRELGSS